MDPVSLTLGGVVAALVMKAADKTGEQLAGSGLAAVSKLVERLQSRFTGRDDSAAEAALVRVQDPPAGSSHLAALAAAVDRHAAEDAAFAEDLRRLVQDGASAGVDVQRISQVAWGSGNVQIGNAIGSNINVNTDRPWI